MILSQSQLDELTANYQSNEIRYFSAHYTTKVFLSHKHTEKHLLLKIKNVLEHVGVDVYIDWLDEQMSPQTSGSTAIRLKEKIKVCDKFILVATDDAIASKWCNWELGLGDAAKYSTGKIALFPVRKDGNTYWNGSEYMQIYPIIE